MNMHTVVRSVVDAVMAFVEKAASFPDARTPQGDGVWYTSCDVPHDDDRGEAARTPENTDDVIDLSKIRAAGF